MHKDYYGCKMNTYLLLLLPAHVFGEMDRVYVCKEIVLAVYLCNKDSDHLLFLRDRACRHANQRFFTTLTETCRAPYF